MKYFNCVLLLSLMIAIFSLNGCTPSSAKASDEKVASKSYVEKQEIKVTSDVVKRSTFSKELISNGKLAAKEKAIIPFEVNEQISEVRVIEGQHLKKGTLIAAVNAFTFKKRKKDAKNTFNKALIDLEDLLLGYGYALKDTAKVSVNILKMCRIRSGFNTASSALEEAERNLSHTRITTPISGVVSNLQAKENNHSAQYKYCCQIIDNSSMEVEFHVLEGELGMVSQGQTVQVFPFALPEVKKTGTITSVNPTVEDGLIKVTAQIPNKDGTLIDGMSVKMLVKKEVPDCIVIPKSAVLYRQNRKVVFIHRKGIAHWVYVKIGMENSTEVCVTDNSLKPGEEVIVSNNLNLAHETPVVIKGVAKSH